MVLPTGGTAVAKPPRMGAKSSRSAGRPVVSPHSHVRRSWSRSSRPVCPARTAHRSQVGAQAVGEVVEAGPGGRGEVEEPGLLEEPSGPAGAPTRGDAGHAPQTARDARRLR